MPHRALSAALVAGAVAATLAVGTVAPAHAETSATHTAVGISSQYHLYDAGVDRSRPVGAVFYVDGDGQHYAQRPGSSVLQSMAGRAAAGRPGSAAASTTGLWRPPPARRCGPPTMVEARITGGGAYQVFDAAGRRTKIVWSAGTGSRTVKEYGAIGRKWAALGYERGPGCPTTDEYPSAAGAAQNFTRGRVQWNAATGAVTVARF